MRKAEMKRSKSHGTVEGIEGERKDNSKKEALETCLVRVGKIRRERINSRSIEGRYS